MHVVLYSSKQSIVNYDRPVYLVAVYAQTYTYRHLCQHESGAAVFTSTNCRNEPYLCAQCLSHSNCLLLIDSPAQG